MKLTTKKPLTCELLSKEEFDNEIQKGMDNAVENHYVSVHLYHLVKYFIVVYGFVVVSGIWR